MPYNVPIVTKCCLCVLDLKTAVAIIAVFGIVTSPTISWAVIRHSYVLRVSCFVTSGGTRQDVVDINLNNVLSFGFGANAGLGPSCLGPVENQTIVAPAKTSKFVSIVKYFGWLVLSVDLIFVMCCLNLLIQLFKAGVTKAAKCFMIMAMLSVLMSFGYGMMYVVSCLLIGGAFPLFEFFFCISDVFVWAYYLVVVNSYIYGSNPAQR